MFKIRIALVAAVLLVSQTEYPKIALAGTCAGSSCNPQPVQFVPGQRITVEVANLTSSILEIQRPEGTDPLPVTPGQRLSFVRGGSTEPNFSLVLWDVNNLPLQVKIVKAEARVLRLEVRPGISSPGDRTVYLKDDGRVTVF